MTTAVLNVAFGERFRRLQDRLMRSLERAGRIDERMFWRRLPPGAPDHQRVPYGFKVAAFEAARTPGAALALWLDASLVVMRDLRPLFEAVRREGVVLFGNLGRTCGEWTSDAALTLLRIGDRDAAMTVPQCVAGVVGLDLSAPRGTEFLARWRALLTAGAFAGPHDNRGGRCSADPRCKGHRHDQSAASAIAWHMGVDLRPWAPWLVDMAEGPQAHREDALLVIDRFGALGAVP